MWLYVVVTTVVTIIMHKTDNLNWAVCFTELYIHAGLNQENFSKGDKSCVRIEGLLIPIKNN